MIGHLTLSSQGTFAISEDQDEMLLNAAFHLSLQCLLSQN